jgi:hypothetical protein
MFSIPFHRTPLLLVGSLLLASCATIAPPDYSADHPANPNASLAPVTPYPATLSSYRPAAALVKTESSPSDGNNAQSNRGSQGKQPDDEAQGGGHERH